MLIKKKTPCTCLLAFIFFISFSEMVIDSISENEEEILSQLILEFGGTAEDLALSREIIDYVMKQETGGATTGNLKVLNLN